jgi:peptidoglycan glycosyltransferase
MVEVPKFGTAAGHISPSLDAAVKTGTAQTDRPLAEGNTDDWMIGFAPANDPKVAVAVVVPYQAPSTSGAQVAGPIMNCMLATALGETDLGGIPTGCSIAPTPTSTTTAPTTTTTAPRR